ncbi:hypothetical protein SteCoe_9340 [Stentor coeruleus]|uniref:Uncharacterized protein n=1 Tax=Stentor coeruleus TaxID=5963 RepID=A0A1R2CI64_9CILI|nr:hypothetical protein SteCoe_9340 [Stentor coeruleus]
MKIIVLAIILTCLAGVVFTISVYLITRYDSLTKNHLTNKENLNNNQPKIDYLIFQDKEPLTSEIKKRLTLSRQNEPYTSENKSCIPTFYGITPEHDSIYFKPKRTFTCPVLSNGVKLNFEKNKTILTCPYRGSIYIGGPITEEIFGSYEFFDYWNLYESPISSPNSEFAFAKCSIENLAILHNNYNYSAAQRAKSITNLMTKNKGIKSRPLTVMIISVDSMSRQNFYRHLTQTQNLLQKYSLSELFSVYDFMLNNAEDWTTVPNMSPFLNGYRIDDNKDNVNGSLKVMSDWSKFEAFQNKTSLWKHFERQGFVTMFLCESSNDFISQFTGRKILTDHVVANFWRVAAKSTRFNEFSTGSQCIGSMPPHNYSLNYIKEYFKNYKGINRFAFAQINTAHEETCNRLLTLDKPLSVFIKETLEFANDNNEDIIMIISGDHGRYYKALTLESFSEKMIPAHFIVASKNLIEKFNIDQNLVHNENMLISRLDWYATIKHMASFPYMTGPPSKAEMQEFYDSLPEKRGKDVFFEKLDEMRNCESLGISENVCICDNNAFTNLPISEKFKDIAFTTIKKLNYLIKAKNFEKNCKLITNYQISEVLKIVKESKEKLENYFIKLLIPDTILDEYENPKNMTNTIVIYIYVPFKDALKFNYNKNRELSIRNELLKSINNELVTFENTVYDVVLNTVYGKVIFSEINMDEINNVCIPKIQKYIIEGQNGNSCKDVCENKNYFCLNKKLFDNTLDFMDKKYLSLDSEGKYKELMDEIQNDYKQKCERIFTSSSPLCECFSI